MIGAEDGSGSTAAGGDRSWIRRAIAILRSGENHATPLLTLHDGPQNRRRILMKDESLQPTGSLKHRLARSLLVDAVCAGRIGPLTTLVEASSGSTAISLANFAKLLSLHFVAVVPVDTTNGKLAAIRASGGELPSRAGPRVRAGGGGAAGACRELRRGEGARPPHGAPAWRIRANGRSLPHNICPKSS